MKLRSLASLKPELKRLQESGGDYRKFQEVASRYERLTAEIAANANLVQIYEHAATHPWETPPLIAEAIDGVENAPIPKRLLTNPPPPEPPGPALPATSALPLPAFW